MTESMCATHASTILPTSCDYVDVGLVWTMLPGRVCVVMCVVVRLVIDVN